MPIAFFLCLFYISKTLASCPVGAIQGINSEDCYQVFPTPTNWVVADENCIRNGGNLASISNVFQNTFLQGEAQLLLVNADSAWIGANTLLGNWTWSDNTPFGYMNWGKGQPTSNQDLCASMNRESGTWFSQDCLTQELPYICKINSTQDHGNTCPTALPCPTFPTTPTCNTCPKGYVYYAETRFCYKLYTQNETCSSAEKICTDDGGSLVSIHSSAENSWLGSLTCKNGQWVWNDGSPLDYTNWIPSYGDCMEGCGAVLILSSADSRYLQWGSGLCSFFNDPFICKHPLM